MLSAEFDPGWKGFFERLPEEMKVPIVKKMKKILEGIPGRHLKHGLDYFVAEVGQYRICYKALENSRKFYFVGDHKEYEKWIRGKS